MTEREPEREKPKGRNRKGETRRETEREKPEGKPKGRNRKGKPKGRKMTKPRLICALTAHVDEGKTTLSEAMLCLSGALRRAGRVDHGSAFLDTEKLEKERGITIFSKQAELEWKKRPITLVDTPGHADFSGETERALGIADCAVMVLVTVLAIPFMWTKKTISRSEGALLLAIYVAYIVFLASGQGASPRT